jgi:hypothetical protein
VHAEQRNACSPDQDIQFRPRTSEERFALLRLRFFPADLNRFRDEVDLAPGKGVGTAVPRPRDLFPGKKSKKMWAMISYIEMDGECGQVSWKQTPADSTEKWAAS